MADVISFAEVARARHRACQRALTRECVHIIEANLQLLLQLFAAGPEAERPVRARQIRQLGELLEYVVAR